MPVIASYSSAASRIYRISFILSFAIMLLLRPAGNKAFHSEQKGAGTQAPRTYESPQTEARDPKQSGTLSPYDIARYINENENADIRQIWRWLGLNITSTDLSYKCNGNCEADTFVINYWGGKAIAAKISYTGGDYYQYLIFKNARPGENTWRFLGHFDSSGQRYGSPEHRVETWHKKSWIVIKELWGRGSGFVLYGEKWYQIDDTAIKKVFAYPASGHVSSYLEKRGRETGSMLLDVEDSNGTLSIKIQFSVSYNFGDDPVQQLFFKEQHGYFRWDSKSKKFVFDSSRSQVTESELDKVFGYDESMDEKDFVEYNYQELLEMATRGNEIQKGWLSRYLDNVPDSPQKSALRQALEQ